MPFGTLVVHPTKTIIDYIIWLVLSDPKTVIVDFNSSTYLILTFPEREGTC